MVNVEPDLSSSSDFWEFVFVGLQRTLYKVKIVLNVCLLFIALALNDNSELNTLHGWLLITFLAIGNDVIRFPEEAKLKVAVFQTANRMLLHQKLGMSIIFIRLCTLFGLLHAINNDSDSVDDRVMSKLSSTVFIDISQLTFWTSENMPLYWTLVFCATECLILCFRFWTLRYLSSIPPDDAIILSNVCISFALAQCIACLVSQRVQEVQIFKVAYKMFLRAKFQSERKQKMVNILCTVMLAPIHKMMQSVKAVSITMDIGVNTLLAKRITCAANQVCLYANNFPLLIRLQEGRLQFKIDKTVEMMRLLDDVASQIPSLDPAYDSLRLSKDVEIGIVTSDPKALRYVLQNVFSYALTVCRRRMLEMSSRLKRRIAWSEIPNVYVNVRKATGVQRQPASDGTQLLEVIVVFGTVQLSSQPHHPGPLSTSIDASTVQFALDLVDDSARPFDVEVAEIFSNESSSQPVSLSSKVGKRFCSSCILLTAKRILDSCGGSLRLIEVPLATPSKDVNSPNMTGGENIIVLRAPFKRVAPTEPSSIRRTQLKEASMFNRSSSNGNGGGSGGGGNTLSTRGSLTPPSANAFLLGFLVEDDELGKYGMELFVNTCDVRCLRVPGVPRRGDNVMNLFPAIVTDSLTIYSQLRMNGFIGKVIIMSTDAVYIDGISSGGQTFDYALSVPCEPSEVKILIRALLQGARQSTVMSLPSFRPQLLIKAERFLSNHSDEIPLAHCILQFIKFRNRLAMNIGKEVRNFLSQRRLEQRKQERGLPQYETETFVGHNYEMDISWFAIQLFQPEIEEEYRLWKLRHMRPALKTSQFNPDLPNLISDKFLFAFILSSNIAIVLPFLWEGIMLSITATTITNYYTAIPPFFSALLILFEMLVSYIPFLEKYVSLSSYSKFISYFLVFIAYCSTVLQFIHFTSSSDLSSGQEYFLEKTYGCYNGIQLVVSILASLLSSQSIWLLPFHCHAQRMLHGAKVVRCICHAVALVPVFRHNMIPRILEIAYIFQITIFLTRGRDFQMRKNFQAYNKDNYVKTFLNKSFDAALKELRHPVKTLLDFQDEYLSSMSTYLQTQPARLSPNLMRHLTIYRLSNLKLMCVQTFIKLEKGLVEERECISKMPEPKWTVVNDLRLYLMNLGRVFDAEEPICIKVFIRVASGVPNRIQTDFDFMQSVIVRYLLQAVEGIKKGIKSQQEKKHLVSLVYEIILNISVSPKSPEDSGDTPSPKFMHFEILDTGMPWNEWGTIDSDFKFVHDDKVCQAWIERNGGLFTRDVFPRNVCHNMVSFSLPFEIASLSHQQDVPPIAPSVISHGDMFADSLHCARVYEELLDKHIQWNVKEPGSDIGADRRMKSRGFDDRVTKRNRPPREIGEFSRNLLIVLQSQMDIDMVARNFRMKGWRCVSVGSHQHLETVTDLKEIDAIVIDDDLSFTHIDSIHGQSIGQRLKQMLPHICVAGLLTTSPHTGGTKADRNKEYDVTFQRPFVDKNVDVVNKACTTNTINALLWCMK